MYCNCIYVPWFLFSDRDEKLDGLLKAYVNFPYLLKLSLCAPKYIHVIQSLSLMANCFVRLFFFKEWHVKIYLILIRGRGLATFNQKINILYTLKIGSECCLSFNLIPSFSFWSQCKQHDQLHCCCTRFRFFILYLICHTIMRLTNDDIYSLYIECICFSLCLLMCCCTSAREMFVQMDTPSPLHVNGCQI